MAKGVLDLRNWRLGQRRDGALRDDALQSARDLKNYDIIYTDGRLRVRKGYDKFNAVALDGPATQLYYFVPKDTSEDPLLVGIVDGPVDYWYIIRETGPHTLLSSNSAVARQPIVTFGDRLIFATDTDVRWGDSTSMAAAPLVSYRLGIEPPTVAPTVALVNGEGNIGTYLIPTDNQQSGDVAIGLRLDNTFQEKLAMSYTPAAEQTLRNVHLRIRPFYKATDTEGSFRVAIYTGAVEPTTLVSEEAISDWIGMLAYTADSIQYVDAQLQGDITLTAATKYWFVLEPDSEYTRQFRAPHLSGAGEGFYVSFAYTSAAPAGTSLEYTGAAWQNQTRDYEATFLVGGMSPTRFYDYKITYYNDTYKSESRPSPKSPSIGTSLGQNRATVTVPAASDGQVDFLGVYRRDRGDDPNVSEGDITSKYEWVGKVVSGGTFTDTIGNQQVGAELQSDDNYTYDYTETEGEGPRVAAIQPKLMEVWKSRLWMAVEDSNILYFSKIYEANGPMGLIGDAAPDYFPVENRLEMPAHSGIIAMKTLSDDQMAVYFKDESIWVISGTNDVQNPPADIIMRDKTPVNGLIAASGIDNIAGLHTVMTRDGLYLFNGQPVMAFLSETNQSILDAIENTYLETSIVRVFGNEIWCLIDDDNDGNLETILILDMQRDIQTRQLYDRAWRTYDYGFNINDLVVRRTGGTFKTVLAASGDSNYVMELGKGTTDDGTAITAEVETQDLQTPTKAFIHQVDIDAYYPSTVPTYSLTLTNHEGDTVSYSLTPSASGNIREHRTGCRLRSPVSVRAKLIQVSTEADELRAITIKFKGD